MTTNYNLTPREKEVLQHLALGLADSQIAENLTIERTTVKTHLNRIFPKLRVNSRGEATFNAILMGLIDCPCSLSPNKNTSRGSN